MQNSVVVFTFSVLERKHPFLANLETPFLGKFGPKNQNRQSKLKFSTQIDSNMQKSVALFTFFILDRKQPFWTNLVQKIKIVSLRRNVAPRPIRISRIQWRCSLFLF